MSPGHTPALFSVLCACSGPWAGVVRRLVRRWGGGRGGGWPVHLQVGVATPPWLREVGVTTASQATHLGQALHWLDVYVPPRVDLYRLCTASW